jgi:hypothetical protein
MTATEWLIKELTKIPFVKLKDVFEKAKEMEKQQIIDAYESQKLLTGNQYYQETFKNKIK